MQEINNSFQFSASRDVLEQFLKHIHSSFLKKAEIDNYYEEFQKDNILCIYFDGFGKLKEFVSKMQKLAKKFKIDFDCALIVGWSLEGDYYLFTYRHSDNILKCFELLPEHKSTVTQLDEENYEFQGKNYHDSDVPGVLGEDMIRYFYKDSIDKLLN